MILLVYIKYIRLFTFYTGLGITIAAAHSRHYSTIAETEANFWHGTVRRRIRLRVAMKIFMCSGWGMGEMEW